SRRASGGRRAHVVAQPGAEEAYGRVRVGHHPCDDRSGEDQRVILRARGRADSVAENVGLTAREHFDGDVRLQPGGLGGEELPRPRAEGAVQSTETKATAPASVGGIQSQATWPGVVLPDGSSLRGRAGTALGLLWGSSWAVPAARPPA
ncbi:hypothetical protein JYK22_36140, partial [Nonomuraea sp. RK-328]|nr:hypothetical protein [Nonomuraea sp. RK-328]